ncbi:MAG: signal recognition particle-docking protein FtsY, partial [Sphingomonadales bacterium]|nr:signal recognition particle-docking protein FtsY [Sphingomonadales bacterium]
MTDKNSNKKTGWFSRLKAGLSKSSENISTGISDIFTKTKLDVDTLDNLEDLLIAADLGVATATKISEQLAKTRLDKDITPEEVRQVLADEVAKTLEPVAKPLVISGENKPHVIIMTGVNGSGKTTTIGKMASQMKGEGKSVMIAAADTFRAAAIEQLEVWGERIGVPVVRSDVGADPASVAYKAVQEAIDKNVDVLFIDTAGRLQNRRELMEELEKIIRVIGKKIEGAPHDTILVLDATTGQNATGQAEVFSQSANITGLVMTKLDGSAKGGILVALAEKFAIPVHAIGVGEGVDDLQPFNPDNFAKMLVGLESE